MSERFSSCVCCSPGIAPTKGKQIPEVQSAQELTAGKTISQSNKLQGSIRMPLCGDLWAARFAVLRTAADSSGSLPPTYLHSLLLLHFAPLSYRELLHLRISLALPCCQHYPRVSAGLCKGVCFKFECDGTL